MKFLDKLFLAHAQHRKDDSFLPPEPEQVQRVAEALNPSLRFTDDRGLVVGQPKENPKHRGGRGGQGEEKIGWPRVWPRLDRSEEHTSELHSLAYLVCRLLLEKKKD